MSRSGSNVFGRLAAAIAFVPLLLGPTSPAQALVGATTEGSPLASSMIMVLTRSGRTAGFCTGIVLTSTTILTAAHCAPPGADLRIHFPDPGQAPVLLPVDRIVRHPDYRPDAIRTRQRSVDLALIHLPEPLPSHYRPVQLAQNSGTKAGLPFMVSGFGLSREDIPASSGRLRSAHLAARQPLSNLLLWASDPTDNGTGACTGDSGAPVMAEGSTDVTAIVVWSAGTGRHQCGALTQALWLAPQRAWIDSVLRSWER